MIITINHIETEKPTTKIIGTKLLIEIGEITIHMSRIQWETLKNTIDKEIEALLSRQPDLPLTR